MTADELRAAAGALDAAATALETVARQLHTVLPDGCWRGPAAARFQAESRHVASTVARAADAARDGANRIVTRALALEAAGRVPAAAA